MTDPSTEHGPEKAPYDDLNIRSIALIGGVGAVLVFVAAMAVQVVFFRYEQAEHRRKVLDVPTTKANAALDAQRARLVDAGDGANVEAGERSIPIDDAMQLVLAEYQAEADSGAEPGDNTSSDDTDAPADTPSAGDQEDGNQEEDQTAANAATEQE